MKIFTLLCATLIVLGLALNECLAKATYGDLKITRVVSVYDGDTIRVDIENIHSIIGNNIGIRINGIDTPEMRDKRPQVKLKAIKARDYLRQLINKAEQIELRNIQRGKYFRIAGDLYLDGVNVSSLMMNKGLAKPYWGGRKSKW